jgi:inorganic pyrophosphatase
MDNQIMRLDMLPAFIDSDAFRVVIESPRGSTSKLKFDPEIDAMTLSRPLTYGMAFPYDWGFIPGTRASDGDPLDAMLISDLTTFPGVVIPCRAVGVVKVDQNRKKGRGRERNDRVLAVPLKAPRSDQLRNVRNLTSRSRKELEEFFRAITALEKKDIRFLGWDGPDAALRTIRKAIVQSDE